MIDVIAIKDYFRKLQRVIDMESTFTFFNYVLVKKTRIDDITCCIYATLPDSYKKMLKTKVDVKQYGSIISYGMLTKLLACTFILDKNVIVIDRIKINNLINTILKTIERDINKIEQMYN